MLISQFTHRSNSPLKENINHSHFEQLKAAVSRNEQMLISVRKELSLKLNRTEFLSAMSSKVSLSDITNLTSHSYSSHQDSLHTIRYSMEEQLKTLMKQYKLEKDEGTQMLREEVRQLRKQLQHLSESAGKREEEWRRQVREGERGVTESLERKVERSEFDKMMHLSSLLAIEFELIKKRFGNFQVDYNLVWKEISNLYAHQQDLKSVIHTDRNSSIQNTKEKLVLALTKTGKRKGLLFGQKEEERTYETHDAQQTLMQMSEKVQLVEQRHHEHQYSISSFGERLLVVEKGFEKWMETMQDIHRLKRQYSDSRSEIVMLEERAKGIREEVSELVKAKCELGVREVGKQIGHQIKQACEQISSKMLHLFSECAKMNETQVLRNNIAFLEEQLEQKLSFFMDYSRKRMDGLVSKDELIEDKVRLIAKDVAARVKFQQLEQVKQHYLTSEVAHSILKKSEGALRKEISDFRDSQTVINEVVCSQTILARWIWVSGQLKGGNLVSWDKETVNTLPENFIYSSSEMSFKVVSGGIYKIEMGFYAKKKPSVQIIVNGKTIVSAVNSSSYVVHHSSGKLKDITNSEIAGLTYYDYFTLPENSRLAISYNGEPGHGFLGIQRL